MRTVCPACGNPLPRDGSGERIYQDWCEYCSWTTSDRRAADNLNEAIFQYEMSIPILAETIWELQATYDRGCGFNAHANDLDWKDQPSIVKTEFLRRARKVLMPRTEEMRQRLIDLRAAARARQQHGPPTGVAEAVAHLYQQEQQGKESHE